MRHSPKTLSEIQDFKVDGFTSKLCTRIAVSENEAQALFEEVKRWLWLVANAPQDVQPTIFEPILIIDEAWHEFLLFTTEYAEFCNNWLGLYIHHYPHTRSNSSGSVRPELILQTTISLVHDMLGAETAVRWFRVFPQKYSWATTLQLKRTALDVDEEFEMATRQATSGLRT